MQSPLIIAISGASGSGKSLFTKNLFNERYGVNPEKSYVINIGKDDFFCPDKNSIKLWETPSSYSLYEVKKKI